MYQALYRKWRPKAFDDLVGQDHIATTLENEVASGKLSHAYLFCGTRGTGKTSTAKILAKAVNCPTPRGGNPCCECAMCKAIEDDACLDITEIDAASNSGVDNIRELRDQANFTPTAARYRVYIIDETHMLSTGAFNALLKIMEEPPEHVLFILATTEIHKVPATILSRCQRFDFRRIPADIIAARLQYVAEQETLELSEGAAALIARLADGGMRDALSLLDLCVAAGGAIDEQRVSDSVGVTGQEALFDLAEALAAGDAGAALQHLQSMWARAGDPVRLCEQLCGFFRNAMVAKAVPAPEELVPCLPEELERLKAFAAGQSMERILHSVDVLQEALNKMSRTTARRTELEVALLKLANPALSVAAPALLARLEKLERVASRPGGAAPAAPSAPVGAAAQPAQAPASPVEQAPAAAPKKREGAKAGETPALQPFGDWDKVLQALSEKNMPLYGTLVGSTAYEGGDLLLVRTDNTMFLDMMRGDTYAKESLRAAAQEVTGRSYRLGPYDPERYALPEQPQQQAPGGEEKQLDLDALLKRASDLGVDVQVK